MLELGIVEDDGRDMGHCLLCIYVRRAKKHRREQRILACLYHLAAVDFQALRYLRFLERRTRFVVVYIALI